MPGLRDAASEAVTRKAEPGLLGAQRLTVTRTREAQRTRRETRTRRWEPPRGKRGVQRSEKRRAWKERFTPSGSNNRPDAAEGRRVNVRTSKTEWDGSKGRPRALGTPAAWGPQRA